MFDDLNNIRDNPVIRDLSVFTDFDELSRLAAHLGELESSVRTRYISFLSFALNYRLHGLETYGYHLLNLIIHLSNALLVYLIGIRLWRLVETGDERELNQLPLHGHWAGLVAALLFVSHPLQTQAVSYIVQRMTSLATLFLLLAMVLYLEALLSDRIRIKFFLFAGVFVCGLLGVLSKEFVLLLPGFFLGLECLNKHSTFPKKVLRLLLFLPVSFVPPIMLFGFNSIGKEEMGEALRLSTSGPTLSSLEYFYTQMRVVPRYLQLFVWPVGQNIDHDIASAHLLSDHGVWSGALLILLLLLLLTWFTFRSLNNVSQLLIAVTGWLFCLALLPESSFFPIDDVMFEHRMYLPMVWLSLFFGFSLAWGAASINSKQHKNICVLMGLLILLLTGTTWGRNLVWTDNERLWRDSVAKSPMKARPHHNLAKSLEEKGRREEALPFFLNATKLDPTYVRYRYNYARNLHESGRLGLAVEEYRHTLLLDPEKKEAHFNLAVLSLTLGDFRTAEKSFMAFLKLPEDRAETGSRRLLLARHSLANLLRDQGRYFQANLQYQKALRLNPELVELNNDYGIALADQGRYLEAEEFLSRAASLPGCFSEAHNNLGVLLLMLERMDAARTAFQKALACDPNNPQALSNLNLLNSQ